MILSKINSHFRLFLDPTTYVGFYAPLVIQAATGITYMGLICTLIALQIGMCSYIKSFTLDLQKQCERLDESVSEIRTKLVLKEAIELHIDMLK